MAATSRANAGRQPNSKTTFAITKLVPKHTTAIENGKKQTLRIDWKGKPTFPVVVNLVPKKGCSTSDFTCYPGSISFDKKANPLVWKDAAYCTGTIPKGSPTFTGKWSLWLTDAKSHKTKKITWTFSCVFK